MAGYIKKNNEFIPLTGDGYGLPLGTIIAYEGSVPDGFLACDGSAYNTTTYSALYALLGVNTTPNLTSQNMNNTDGWCIKATPAYVEPDTVSDMVDLILKHESPDWGNAVNVSLSTTGYVCPDDGWIAFDFYTTIANQDVTAFINNILVAESYNGGNWSYGGRGVVKVNKNDVVTLSVNITSGFERTKFIPHK